MELLHQIVNAIVEIIKDFWYIWIFLWMLLESSFFPFPSEVIMIPAWYLAYKWEMNLILVIMCWTLWSLAGAWLNYILASKLWRKFLLKILSEKKINYLDEFFEKHGHISTFTWRLIPWVRQYISFPAWLAKMSPVKFTFYTSLWAWIWVTILALLGYFIWHQSQLINKYLKEITLITLVFVIILIWIYIFLQKRKNKKCEQN